MDKTSFLLWKHVLYDRTFKNIQWLQYALSTEPSPKNFSNLKQSEDEALTLKKVNISETLYS